ncbi:MAG TPA: glycosyl hydrolase [Terriglobales bacterium]|nr:glycosyl hydrolase [Terriglobales bacterium]
MKHCKASLSATILMIAGITAATAQTAPESLQSGFENPPASAHPLVWWHWMNGNITQEGIKLDLDWMHRVGLSGFQNFDAALSTPQVVQKRLAYMTPEWKDAFRYATQTADQLNLEEAIAGSPGWSESGGPWVPPSEGMKKYVWSETLVEGGKPFTGTLTHPPQNTGAFQNVGIHDDLGAPAGAKPIPQYYADSVVIAYRKPASDVPVDSLHPKITANGGAPDMAMLTDGDLEKTTEVPIPAQGEKSWIQYEFSRPTTIRSITVVTKAPNRFAAMFTGIAAPVEALEASDDGQNFREVAKLPEGHAAETTVSFAPVTAKYFRVSFMRGTPPPRPAWAAGLDPASFGFPIPKTPTGYDVAELVLHPGARVNNFEEKAAFVPVPDLYGSATPSFAAGDAVKKSDVIDLTSKMKPDGTLDWTPPSGHWVVLRFGYSLLGITNHPATAEATGLEVDKLDHRFVRNYMEKYLDSYKETVGPDLMGKRGIRYVINDSWEAGSQNWTDNMIDQFRKRRGYDPIPWMPVLTGEVVESSAASDRFLWDFRKTIADLIADEHYGELEKVLHEWSMGHYGESHESGRAFVADGMEVKKFNEIPMSAMWTQSPGVNNETYGYNADDRESASVAHIYGRKYVAAESMTAAAAPWAWSPATLKPTADQEFLNGINRIVIHESAHQPLVDKKPGLSLGPFGQWFNRNETWADEASAWINYLARTSYMLQQGHFGADLVYFYGEDSNLTAIFENKSPDVPAGYGFDYINADALIHELTVSDGHLTTPGGTTYRLLGLDPYSRHMSLPVLQAIHKLVSDGAVLAGPMPADDPSLADNQAEFNRLRSDLFGNGTGVHHLGKGTVYAGQTPVQALSAMHVPPDFDYSKPNSNTRLEFVHRHLPDADIYFVENRSDANQKVDATFNISGKAPELWYAETGKTEPASFHIAEGRTTVPLQMEPWGTVFVVFRTATSETSHTVPTPEEKQLTTVSGPWTVTFPPNWGAPASITLDQLASWSDNSDAGVKYFSGTGAYTKTIDAPQSWFANGGHVWIDLGDVKNLAEVLVNGKSLGIVWHAPYRIELTPALKPGSNELTVKVTNAWVNRMIGDQQPGATKYTFTAVHPYRANSPLLPSGLLGPVTLYSLSSAQ